MIKIMVGVITENGVTAAGIINDRSEGKLIDKIKKINK